MDNNGTTRHLMNGYSKIFDVSELCAKKFFKYYRPIFLANAVEVSDLIQEAHLKVLETIRRYPTKGYDEVFKLSNLAVSWHLRNLYNNASGYFSFKITQDDNDTKQDAEQVVRNFQYNEELTYKYFQDAEKSHRFHFEELLAVLDDNEYEILSKVIKYNRSFQSIALEREVSRQYIQKVYKTAILKAKKYLMVTP